MPEQQIDLDALPIPVLEEMLDSGTLSIPPDADVGAAVVQVGPESDTAEDAVEPDPVEDPATDVEPEAAAEEPYAGGAPADLEEQLREARAHSSRLAGELGFLKERLRAIEPYRPDTEAEIDRLAELERRQAQMEAETRAREVAQAVSQSLAITDANTLLEFKEEIAAVVPRYEKEFQDLMAMTDPQLARQSAETIRRSVLADAKEMRWQSRHRDFTEKRAATVPDAIKAKRAATVSASGAVPAAPPRPRTVDDMSPEELDRWLRQNAQ